MIMTLQITLVEEKNVYLPSPIDGQLGDIFSFSPIDENSSIYLASYSVIQGSNLYYAQSFTAFPQNAIFLNQNNYIQYFKNENVFDNKVYAILGSNLLKYENQSINYSPISANMNSGNQYTILYGDDILILRTLPSSVQVYSVNKNQFYYFSLPTINISGYYYIGSATFLGNTIYVGLLSVDNQLSTVQIQLLYAQFTYSNSTFSIVPNFNYSIPLSLTTFNTIYFGITVKANLNIVNVVLLTSFDMLSTVTYFYQYNTSNQQIQQNQNIDTSTYLLANFLAYQNNTYELNGKIMYFYSLDQITSIYGQYLYIVPFLLTNNYIQLLSYNNSDNTIDSTIFTGQYETIEGLTVFLFRNKVYLYSKYNNNIKYNNTYFLQIEMNIYEITSSHMYQIAVSSYALNRNNLEISGTVLNVQSGQTVPNVYVHFYYAQSINGNQYGLGQEIGKTVTDSNGNFSFKTTLDTSIPDLNLIMIVSVDPVITIFKSTTTTSYYYTTK